MDKSNVKIDSKKISYLKDTEEHGFEGYTENVVKEKIIISFGNKCGCSGSCGNIKK